MSSSKLEIYGGCDVNYIWCKNGTISSSDINELVEAGIESPEWDRDTIALATFIQDLSASCFDQSKAIVGYKIRRLDSNNKFCRIADIDINKYNKNIITDHNARNHLSYEYWIFPVYIENGEKVIGSPIKSDIVNTNWCNWTIVGLKPTDYDDTYGIDKDNIWNFGLNVKVGDLTPHYKKVYEDGFGRFSKGFVGDTNYYTGSMSCLIGDVSCSGDYSNDTVERAERWNRFCQSSCLKLIKDRKGHAFIADIEDTTFSFMENAEDITSISFTFRQMADDSKVSVYELEV